MAGSSTTPGATCAAKPRSRPMSPPTRSSRSSAPASGSRSPPHSPASHGPSASSSASPRGSSVRSNGPAPRPPTTRVARRLASPRGRMFRKLLVANRGEIACRVIRTLRALGTASVAVYHFVDRDAPHTAAADERIELRARTPARAYLDIDQILAACKATGADALHPGYGFLSESAELAEACARGGVTFIGPSPEAMRALGD